MGLLYVESRKKMWISLWIIWKNPWMEMNPMLWIMVENVEESPVYRDLCKECAYLGLNYSEEEMRLYSIAITSVEHKLFGAKINNASTISTEGIINIYNRIHLGILGFDKAAQEALIERAIAFSKKIVFVNNGNFDVRPEYFIFTP